MSECVYIIESFSELRFMNDLRIVDSHMRFNLIYLYDLSFGEDGLHIFNSHNFFKGSI